MRRRLQALLLWLSVVPTVGLLAAAGALAYDLAYRLSTGYPAQLTTFRFLLFLGVPEDWLLVPGAPAWLREAWYAVLGAHAALALLAGSLALSGLLAAARWALARRRRP